MCIAIYLATFIAGVGSSQLGNSFDRHASVFRIGRCWDLATLTFTVFLVFLQGKIFAKKAHKLVQFVLSFCETSSENGHLTKIGGGLHLIPPEASDSTRVSQCNVPTRMCVHWIGDERLISSHLIRMASGSLPNIYKIWNPVPLRGCKSKLKI